LKRIAVAAVLALSMSAFAVEVNSASQAELEQIRGVGVALSERLVAEREKRPFRNWADLIDRLPGIGPKQAARLSTAGLRIQGTEYEPSSGGQPAAPHQ
jgi:competence protein ComEA